MASAVLRENLPPQTPPSHGRHWRLSPRRSHGRQQQPGPIAVASAIRIEPAWPAADTRAWPRSPIRRSRRPGPSTRSPPKPFGTVEAADEAAATEKAAEFKVPANRLMAVALPSLVGAGRALPAEGIATTLIETLFAGRLAELRALRAKAKPKHKAKASKKWAPSSTRSAGAGSRLKPRRSRRPRPGRF